MLLLSPVWHGRVLTSRRLANLTLQTFVIHPALLFFLLFLLMSKNGGSGGQMLLDGAESLVRGAPPGQVWGCAPQATPAPLTAPRDDAPVPVVLKPAPPAERCVKAAVSREAWADQTNRTLMMLYACGVLLSLTAGITGRALRRRWAGGGACRR